jgi:hypothetical protein
MKVTDMISRTVNFEYEWVQLASLEDFLSLSVTMRTSNLMHKRKLYYKALEVPYNFLFNDFYIMLNVGLFYIIKENKDANKLDT